MNNGAGDGRRRLWLLFAALLITLLGLVGLILKFS